MKSRKKRGVDVPPKVKSFILSVTSVPLENIQDPLSQFSWDFEKGDFHHWSDLFYHFDTFFEKYVKTRKDLQLEEDFVEFNEGLPKDATLQILRVTRIILENCTNKYLYRSHEHVMSLLAATDPEIVISALQTLAALVRKPVQSNRPVRWHGDPVMNGKLFSLSQGWGGKEEGLGLLSCAVEGGCDFKVSQLASTLHFEFYADGSIPGDSSSGDGYGSSGLQVIHIPDIHLRPESDLQLFKQLLDQYHVPKKLRFSLFTRLRFARAFHSLPIRRQYICIRLLAFTALLQSNPDHEELTAFFVNEPEFVNELVALLQSENTVPEDIRILAVLALAAQAQDRPRQSNVLAVVSAGGHRGILPSLVQKAVASLTNEAGTCSIAFADALLSLVTVLVSSSSGCAALREAGLISTLLPLLKDTKPQHVDLVTSAVHILEAFMDYSNPAGTLFRDLGGLDDTIMRLQFEVSHVEVAARDKEEDMQVLDKGKSVGQENKDVQTPESSVQNEALIPYRQRLLLKALLRAIALGTYASGNTTRLHGSEESALPACLHSIFKHAKEFGGGVFSLAASVMSDLINKDPTCFPVLHAAGLPAAFLDSITAGVLPSSDSVGCIPHALDAICLNNIGLQAVKDCNALQCFVKIFTSKSYLKALGGDTPAAIASGLDELMRHAPSLRGPGVDACIDILKAIAVMGGAADDSTVDVETSDVPIPMETDSEEVSSVREEDLKEIQGADTASDTSQATGETFLPECINNTVQMLETIFQNADTCRVFIEKKGIEELLRLFTLPRLPVTFGGSPTAYNMFLTFRAFSSQHANTLTKAVCSAFREHLKTTAVTLESLQSSRLSDLDAEIRAKVLRELSASECFLSLTAFLVRSLAPMMTEINSLGTEVFNDIGAIHRWVQWQISVLDDEKIDSKREEESTSKANGSGGASGGARDTEDEPEAMPVLRYVNPGSRTRWGLESELISLLPTDQGDRRSRREHVATELLNHVARLGRLARHATVRTVRGDLDSTGSSGETVSTQEPSKRKSADTLNHEMMVRLATAARGLYVALGKAMAVPSRRRDDAVTVSPVAKAIASSLSILFLNNLQHDGCVGSSSSSSESSMSVKCRYLGKVVEDITAVVMDSRKRNCNTVMVNCLYAHGTIKQLLTTFEATSQLLWTSAPSSGTPMETETGKMEAESSEPKVGGQAWLLETLRNYARLLEYLVTSSTLLVPSAMAQLLVQPVSGETIPIPKDPENFVLALQAQVLEVVLPVWNHPMFPQCNPNLIESLCSILRHIYSGIRDTKGQRSHEVGTTGNRFNLSPPNESTISMIVEMGFSRARAEEALRRVGRNSVEMAMEWLFGHPEEVSQEDDELARALALSLGSGNSDTGSEDTNGKAKELVTDEAKPQPPPIEGMLSTCMNLLNSSNTVAFPLAELLVTMCTRSKGQDRAKVIPYLIQHLKLYKAEESDSDASPLSTISHLLALILSEDSFSREVAAENGIVSIGLDILSNFKNGTDTGDKQTAPKWVTALLLIFDYMLQFKPKYDSNPQLSLTSVTEDVASDASGSNLIANKDDTEKVESRSWEAVLGKPTGYMTEDEQHRTMSAACKLLSMKLPATTVQAALQLCARLTKSHMIAMQFLDAGGLSALLSLPSSSLFPGFENVAAAIIRHLLEDPQTLQQAMESEIRHSLAAAQSRNNGGRLSPQIFLTTMARVVARDPAIFLQAAASVCQIEEVGGRPYVILAKEKEKDKDKEKEKEKEKVEKEKYEKDKGKGIHDESNLAAAGTKGIEGGKLTKGHKKVPQSFAHVLEQLLDVILDFVPPEKDSNAQLKVGSPGSATAMEVDEVLVKDKGKAKVDEPVTSEKPSVSGRSAALSKVTFILKLITEIILMYSAAVSVVLRRDTESCQGRGPYHAGSDVIGHGGLLYHVLHRLIPSLPSGAAEKTSENELREKLSSKAAHFLVAVCMRSAEGRRRLFSEIAKALLATSKPTETSLQDGLKAPDRQTRAFVDLLNTILSSHTSSGGGQAPGVSAEMAKAMLDAGMVQALTSMLQVIDLDHPDAPKLAGGIAKALEALTRAAGDHLYGAETTNAKKNTGSANRDGEQRVIAPNGQVTDGGQAEERMNQDIEEASVRVGLHTAIRAMQALVGGDEQLEIDHDMGLDRDADVHLEGEDEEFMHDAAEVAGELEDVATTATMTFRMDHPAEDDLGDEEDDDEDDEEDMEGDAGEEDDEDDEDEEDEEDEDELEDDEVALSPPETDVEDHDLEEEYDEDMAEEDEDEDEEDEWRENRIIEVRWRDGTTGFNHVQVLGHADVGNNAEFSVDPFPSMNIDDLFGAFRRTGGNDRRRGSTYRAFERTGSENTWTSRHPLLSRPNLSSVSASGGLFGSSSWASGGTVSRETDSILERGMDVTRLFMYDGSMLSDNIGDTLFGDRGVGGQGGTFLDFPMYPMPRMGRRNGRTDGRFSSWTDDSQLQGGAHDVALAQAIEQVFLSQVAHLTSSDEQPSSQPTANGSTPAAVDPSGRVSDQVTAEGQADRDTTSGEHEDVGTGEENVSQHAQQNGSTPSFALSTGEAQVYQTSNEPQSQQACNADIDVHMHDERSGSAARDVEAASQDSSGSGATVGESLRSLEVEIGSVDGHDEGDRHAGSVGEMRPPTREILSRSLGAEVRSRQVDTDEDMDGPPVVEGDTRHLPSARDSTVREGDAAENRGEGEDALQRESGDAPMSSIDPAFLEALPEDLRAEVLASQTQTTRTEGHQSTTIEDIDPEFLAALPPEIQAEVLAQQQAQRVLQAQQVEGQPVDMDSASIIATFPAELREEVLLTSEEAVLAALPPALLAEARLLRERAMNQFQTRNFFAQRLGSRRNSIEISGRGVTAAIDRGVEAISGFPGRRVPSVTPNGAAKGKEGDGKPLVDTAALKAILRLLRLAQPLGKGLLQRLLYNLCAHNLTCSTLVELLLDMLRPDAEGQFDNGLSADGAPAHRLYGCQWNVVYARPQLSNGVPPLVSRRVLEILTYLAKHHPLVACLLLYFEPVTSLEVEADSHKGIDPCKEKGKGKADYEMTSEDPKPGHIPLVLLLKLLNQPLYSRSSAHLEQVLGLIEVVTSKAGEIVESRSQTNTTTVESTEQGKTDVEELRDTSQNRGSAAASNGDGGDTQTGALDLQPRPSDVIPKEERVEASTSGSEEKLDPCAILLSLPSEELRKLCLLLAREGLSELAYSRVSEVLNKLADLAAPHRRLFITELADAARNLSSSAVDDLKNLADADSLPISTASMVGSAILRVLLALSALTAIKDRSQEGNMDQDHEESLSIVRDLNTAIEPLWQALSNCAGKIEGRLAVPASASSSSFSMVAGGSAVAPPLSPGTQRVLPFIEAFFVLCDKLRSVPASAVNQELGSATACEIKEAATSASVTKSPSFQQKRTEEKGVTFTRFADRHRRLLNAFVRQNPGLLEKSLSLLLKTPRLIDFDNKRSYFRSRIRQQHEQQHYAPLRISVRRAYVLEDSYNQLRMRTPDELKGRLTVQFQGEEGIDAGGLTREWYQLLSRVIFDKGALLFTTVGNESSFQPNPNSVYQTEHLSYFKFVGRVVAKALFDGQLLDVYFTRSFYKHILGVKVTYHDIEAVDPDFYKNLKWVLENVVSDMLGLTFSIDADEEKHILYERTEVMDHELIPGGRNIRVTEENKHEYVDLVAEHRLTTAIRPQINAFLEGFNELVSRDLVSIFNDKELELLISGLPEIDLEDLKANTEYTGYTAASPVVQWFWEVVRSFSKEDMARLLQFITGTSKVPLEGFRALQGISGPQKFQIHKAYGAPERLPSAHTCFNQLDLPEYSSKEQLQQRLLLAIHEGSEGFGFG